MSDSYLREKYRHKPPTSLWVRTLPAKALHPNFETDSHNLVRKRSIAPLWVDDHLRIEHLALHMDGHELSDATDLMTSEIERSCRARGQFPRVE